MSNHESGEGRCKRWSAMSRARKIAVMAAAAMVFIPVFTGLMGGVTMWLWNWLMPDIFNLPRIGFWQAIGILLLSHILFKGGYARRAGRRQWKKESIRGRMGEEEQAAKAE